MEEEELQAQGYDPYFVDANGAEVHIGELVVWVDMRGNNSRLKAGRVQDITFKGGEPGGIRCMVRVVGKSQNARAETFTRIESDTLVGKLTRLVAACGGGMDDAAIAAAAAEIEAMFAPSDGAVDG